MADESTNQATKDVPQETKEKAPEKGDHIDSMLEDIAQSVREFTKKVVEESNKSKTERTNTGEFAIVGLDKLEKPAAKVEEKRSEASEQAKEAGANKAEGITDVLAAGPLEPVTHEDKA